MGHEYVLDAGLEIHGAFGEGKMGVEDPPRRIVEEGQEDRLSPFPFPVGDQNRVQAVGLYTLER